MKMTNLMKPQHLLLALFVSSALLIGSCKEDDPFVQGDETELTALLAEADAISATATTTDYPQAAITDFNAVLDVLKTAADKPLTQTEINNLNTQLTEALALFDSKAYGFIDESLYLNAGWHFEEGTGTTATAFSAVKHIGVFKAGNAVIMGSAALSPTWVDGLDGGKALYFDKGAHLEVAYTNSFLPVNLTISVWIKPIELYEHNYIVSQNYWTGYKLQTQGGGKPYFTYKKVSGDIIDADNEVDGSVKANQWNHLVVSVNSVTKELKFYVDGTLTKTWPDPKGGALVQTLSAPEPQPFIIGGVATDAELTANFMEWTTAENLGYFKGTIDELKIYKIALTDGQVSKLYNDEKP